MQGTIASIPLGLTYWLALQRGLPESDARALTFVSLVLIDLGLVLVNRSFGTPHAPTLSDLESDLGTLQNVRIQDTTQLPDAIAQVDRSRSYQTYPTITVDREGG